MPFSSWHSWARAAWLGAFYLSREERLPASLLLPLSPAACMAAHTPSQGRVSPHVPLLGHRTSSRPAELTSILGCPLKGAVPLGIRLRTWAPCCQRQYCVHLMEVPGVCLCDLGTLSKPKGLATNKESLVTVVHKPAGTSQRQPNQLHFHWSQAAECRRPEYGRKWGTEPGAWRRNPFFFYCGWHREGRNPQMWRKFNKQHKFPLQGCPSKALSDLFSKLKGERKSQWFQHLL